MELVANYTFRVGERGKLKWILFCILELWAILRLVGVFVSVSVYLRKIYITKNRFQKFMLILVIVLNNVKLQENMHSSYMFPLVLLLRLMATNVRSKIRSSTMVKRLEICMSSDARGIAINFFFLSSF